MAKTDENLNTAFSTKAQASIRYSRFAEIAQKEGYVQAAKLLRALAEAEKISALNHFDLIDEQADTEQKISNGIDNKTYEFTQMYPTFIAQADKDGNSRAAISFKGAMAVDKYHGNLITEMLDNYKKDREFPYFICTVCGNITERYAPERCPTCNSTKDKYKVAE